MAETGLVKAPGDKAQVQARDWAMSPTALPNHGSPSTIRGEPS